MGDPQGRMEIWQVSGLSVETQDGELVSQPRLSYQEESTLLATIGCLNDRNRGVGLLDWGMGRVQ